MHKRRCWSCGAEILPSTAKRNFGRCRPCAKKGWYGRLWEIITGAGRANRSDLLKPQIDELRSVLGLAPNESRSFRILMADIETQNIGANIDWRSPPDEVFSSLRRVRNWLEPTESIEKESADALLQGLARQHHSSNLRFLNLIPGSDSWVIVIVPATQVSQIQKLAVKSGLDKPEVL